MVIAYLTIQNDPCLPPGLDLLVKVGWLCSVLGVLVSFNATLDGIRPPAVAINGECNYARRPTILRSLRAKRPNQVPASKQALASYPPLKLILLDPMHTEVKASVRAAITPIAIASVKGESDLGLDAGQVGAVTIDGPHTILPMTIRVKVAPDVVIVNVHLQLPQVWKFVQDFEASITEPLVVGSEDANP